MKWLLLSLLMCPCAMACDFEIMLAKDIFVDGETMDIGWSGNTTAMFWVEDLFGSIVRQASTGSTWTPRIGGKQGAYVLKARGLGCRAVQSRVFGVVNRSYDGRNDPKAIQAEEQVISGSNQSLINIENAVAKTGFADVRVSAYRGDTAKYSIQVSILSGKDSTPVQKLNIMQKRSSAQAALSIPLGFCGDAEVIASGLGTNATKPISIPCREASGNGQGRLITSFYTLTRLYRKNITLYANLEACEGCMVRVESEGGQMETDALVGRNAFSVQAKQGKNIYLLSVMKGNATLDTGSLVVDFGVEEEPPLADGIEPEVKQNPVVREPREISYERTSSRYLWLLLALIVPISIFAYLRFKA